MNFSCFRHSSNSSRVMKPLSSMSIACVTSRTQRPQKVPMHWSRCGCLHHLKMSILQQTAVSVNKGIEGPAPGRALQERTRSLSDCSLPAMPDASMEWTLFSEDNQRWPKNLLESSHSGHHSLEIRWVLVDHQLVISLAKVNKMDRVSLLSCWAHRLVQVSMLTA